MKKFTIHTVTMYRLMVYCLSAILAAAVLASAFHVLPYNPLIIIFQTALFVAVCVGINAVFARMYSVPYNTESSIITALILSAITGPFVGWSDMWGMVGVSFAAIASKYILVLHKSHVFNPAAFGVVVGALMLGYPASWWIGSTVLTPVVLVCGIVIMAKIRRWSLVWTFLGVYLGLLALNGIEAVRNVLLSSSLLFFVFVMLVEPLTAPQTVYRRMMFGGFVAFVLFFMQQFLSSISYSLELSLLIGNIFALVIEPNIRQVFTLRTKEISSRMGIFWFEPARAFSFLPGQYLEYTLPHGHADRRGMRRYFSIASSPTEPQILLAARFSTPSSSFKQALMNLREHEQVVAAKVSGDFVLPKDVSRKLLFIAGGVGITPFRSMVKYLMDTNQRRDIVLIYAVQDEKDIVFKDIFDQAHAAFGLRCEYVIGARLDRANIARLVPDIRERMIYISGPEPMVQALRGQIGALGVSRRLVKRDYFPGYPEQG